MIAFDQGRPSKVRQFDGGEVNLSYYDWSTYKGQIKTVRTPNELVVTNEYNADDRLMAVTCGTAYRLEYAYDPQGRLVGIAQVPAGR
jgi:YD repeat-containing protein